VSAAVSIKILLADDSPVVRHAIGRFLQHTPDFILVGEASDLPETLEKVATLGPDVVVLDLHMAVWADGDSKRLKGELSTTRLIAISFATDDNTLTLAARLGADRFIDKVELCGKLIPTILELAAPRAHETPC
jgi:DNA-binding NarL/FixJ family response regulator